LYFTNKNSLEFYIEKYKNIKINVTSSTNQSGILYVDEYGNSLYSVLGIGISNVINLVGYSSNYLNSLLLYTDNEYSLHKDYITKDKMNFILFPNKASKYKINAKSDIVRNTTDSNIFLISLTGRTVFKVILNNQELKSNRYTASSTGVTVNVPSLLNPFENELQIIHYSTDQTITQPFYLSYKGVEKRYPITDGTCTTDFFANMVKFNTFSSLNDTISKTFTDTGDYNEINPSKSTTEITNNLNITMYDGSFDLVGEVGSEPFRVVAYDQMTDILFYWSKNMLTVGVNFTLGSDTNTKSITLNFDDRIQVYGTQPIVAYGEGLYGEGVYSMRVISANYGVDSL